MRLAGQEKLGYYPTPLDEVERVAKLITYPSPYGSVRLLDPCAGKGEALFKATDLIPSIGYVNEKNWFMVELSPDRHQAILDHAGTQSWRYKEENFHTLQSDWKNVVVSHASMSFVWLNPPYDWDDDESKEAQEQLLETGQRRKMVRLETRFLDDIEKIIMPKGIMVCIVPEKMLGYVDFRKILAQKFEDPCLYRFKPENYAAFGQIVIVARRRPQEIYQSDDRFAADLKSLEYLAEHGVEEEPRAYRERGYMIPVAPTLDRFTFRGNALMGDDLAKIVQRTGGAHKLPAWRDHRFPEAAPFRPLMPTRLGHATTLLAAGMMGVIRSGEKVLKGSTKKGKIAYDQKGFEIGTKGTEGEQVRKEVTTFLTQIDELDIAKQEFTHYTAPEALQSVLTQHAPRIMELIFERYTPLFDGNVTPEQHAVMDKLIPHKKLPGVRKPGLLPLQRKLAAAASLSARKYGFSIVVGEMGIGKSAISLATLELLNLDTKNAYPAVVMAPSHLVAKWVRECKDVIPDSNPTEVRSIAEVDRFFRKFSDPKRKGIIILSKERAKLGPGIRLAANKRRTPNFYDEFDPVERVAFKRKNRGNLMPITCPKCGAIHTDKKGQPIYELPEGKKEFCKATYFVPIAPTRWADVDPKNVKHTEVECGEPFFQYGMQRKQNLDPDKLIPASPVRKTWPLARHISKKYHIGTFIADELHKYKGKSTDQSRAFHNLARKAKYTIGLTGTLFGGKATDLYFMLYRLYPRAFQREGFKFEAESQFTAKYGRQEHTYAIDHAEAKYGKTTGMERKPISVREVPGISPAVYQYVLPFCIFAKIEDLGIAMPAFTEYIERVDMAPRQRAQYDGIMSDMHDRIKNGYASFTKKGMREAQALLGTYLQTGLCRPNSGFRKELVWWKPEKEGKHEPYDILIGKLPSPLLPREEDEEQEEQFLGTFADSTSDFEEEKHEVADGVDEDAQLTKVAKKAQKKADQVSPVNFTYDPDWHFENGYGPAILETTQYPDEMNPKEEWLVEKVKAQVERGRRTIIYISQTGTRNIQPHVAGILERNGIKTEVLPNGDPRKREQWIANHADCDVLITNPIKVETGMDLVDFQTIIFYEMTYSLFTFWQAVRRVWRLGQTKGVEVFYCVYRNSIEETALALMGQKQQAAHLLYGDSAQTAVSSSVNNADFMAELAKQILSDQHIETDGISLLGAQLKTEDMEELEIEEDTPESEAEPQDMTPYKIPPKDGEGAPTFKDEVKQWCEYFIPNYIEFFVNDESFAQSQILTMLESNLECVQVARHNDNYSTLALELQFIDIVEDEDGPCADLLQRLAESHTRVTDVFAYLAGVDSKSPFYAEVEDFWKVFAPMVEDALQTEVTTLTEALASTYELEEGPKTELDPGRPTREVGLKEFATMMGIRYVDGDAIDKSTVATDESKAPDEPKPTHGIEVGQYYRDAMRNGQYTHFRVAKLNDWRVTLEPQTGSHIGVPDRAVNIDSMVRELERGSLLRVEIPKPEIGQKYLEYNGNKKPVALTLTAIDSRFITLSTDASDPIVVVQNKIRLDDWTHEIGSGHYELVPERAAEEAPKPKPEVKKFALGDVFIYPPDSGVKYELILPISESRYIPGKATIFVRRESDQKILTFINREDFELRLGLELVDGYEETAKEPAKVQKQQPEAKQESDGIKALREIKGLASAGRDGDHPRLYKMYEAWANAYFAVWADMAMLQYVAPTISQSSIVETLWAELRKVQKFGSTEAAAHVVGWAQIYLTEGFHLIAKNSSPKMKSLEDTSPTIHAIAKSFEVKENTAYPPYMEMFLRMTAHVLYKNLIHEATKDLGSNPKAIVPVKLPVLAKSPLGEEVPDTKKLENGNGHLNGATVTKSSFEGGHAIVISPPSREPTTGGTTPMRQQYLSLKAANPDCILLFRLGDFYETFDDDAKVLADVCGVVLTSRPVGNDVRVPLAGIPYHDIDSNISKLVNAGYKVALAEQVSKPGSGLIEREVQRVVTPVAETDYNLDLRYEPEPEPEPEMELATAGAIQVGPTVAVRTNDLPTPVEAVRQAEKILSNTPTSPRPQPQASKPTGKSALASQYAKLLKK